MAAINNGYISQETIAAEIEQAKQKLGPEVVRLRYNTGFNHWDDPAIFFRVVLTDSAAREETLNKVTERIIWHFFDELHPIENWGMRPYFSFRSQSEQATREGIDLNWT